jgi:hypothetical protein
MSSPDRPVEEFHKYSAELAEKRVEDDPKVKAWFLAKQSTWLFLLVLSFLFFYLLDKMVTALSLL